jgi:hypothetical protein
MNGVSLHQEDLNHSQLDVNQNLNYSQDDINDRHKSLAEVKKKRKE